MTTKIIIVALALCTSIIAQAQVKQVAQQLAENEYKKFAGDLPGALDKKVDLYGNAKALKRQFYLEENVLVFANFLGMNQKNYSQKNIGKVFKPLSENSKSGKISVLFHFPDQPTECIVSIQKTKKGSSKRNEETVTYTALTKVDVEVEVSKQGVPKRVAYDNVAMIWDGKVKLVNNEVDHKNTAPPLLRTMIISPVTAGPSVSKEEQMRARAIYLINEYYQNFQRPINKAVVLAPEIPNKTELEELIDKNIKIEFAGDINVHLPAATSQSIELRNVPDILIHVDPAPYMEENGQYSKIEAYHRLALSFTVDFQADKITKVVYNDRLIVPELAPKPVGYQEPQEPIFFDPLFPKGEYYKVQFLLRQSYTPLAELPEIFREANVTVEKYIDEGITYYKYVVPTKSLREAFAIRDRLVEKGIDDAWIAVYENDVRIRPFQGRPETVE